MKTRLHQRGRMLASWLFNSGCVLAILLLLNCCLASVALAQTKQWDKTFGGKSYDKLHSLLQTQDGGYILGGYSGSDVSGEKSENSRGEADYWVVKLNAAGEKEWDKTFGGHEYDFLTSLQQTNDGGYVLGGYSRSDISGEKSENSRGDLDYWVVKLDANGIKQWDKTFGGSAEDYLESLQQTNDGGYILGGRSDSPLSGDKTEAPKGCFIVEEGIEYCPSDFWVVKLDANGNKQWDKTFGGSDGDYLESLQQTSDNGYILGGHSKSGISGDKTEASRGGCFGDYEPLHCTSDYWVVKLDINGNKQWDKTFGASAEDYLTSLQQTNDGGYILGGWSDSPINGDKTAANKGICNEGIVCTSDYWVVKLDADGNKEWDKTFGGDKSDNLESLQQTNDGGYILGGHSGSSISGDKTEASQVICNEIYFCSTDYWVVKLNAAGEKEWDKTFGGLEYDVLTSLQQTSDGGYILGGSSESDVSGDKTEPSRGDSDYWLVKLNNADACNIAVTSFALVNADTHKVIRPLQDGDVIDLSTLPTANIKISARTNPAVVGSVIFHLDGQQVAIENMKPYRYGGPNKLTVGEHTLTATPYCEAKGNGAAGQGRSLHFQVIRQVAEVRIKSDKDNTIDAVYPEINEGTSWALRVGRRGPDGENRLHRALVHFDLSSIPAGSTIDSANLILYIWRTGEAPTGMAVHKLTANWSEYESTWNQAAAGTTWTTPGGDFEPVATASTSAPRIEGDSLFIRNLAADVQTWINNTATNFGWLLKGTDEERSYSARLVAAREQPAIRLRPVLRIYYTPAVNTLPTVSLTTVNNQVNYLAPGRIKLQVKVPDASNTIKEVRFYSGSALLHTEYKAPYGFLWANVPAGEYTLTAVAIDNNGNSTVSAPLILTVTVPVPSGISHRLASVDVNKPEATGLTLVPNPVSSRLQVFTPAGHLNQTYTIAVLSASGQVIKTMQASGSDQTIQVDVFSLAGGVYTLKVISGNRIWYKRFVKL